MLGPSQLWGEGAGVACRGDLGLQLSLGLCQLLGGVVRVCFSEGDITAHGKFSKCGFLGPDPALRNQSLLSG